MMNKTANQHLLKFQSTQEENNKNSLKNTLCFRILKGKLESKNKHYET